MGFIAALVIGKYLAAWLSTRCFAEFRSNTSFVWSLSLPQMAATLAAAVVAYNTVNNDGARLLDGACVNAVLVLVVATCIAGPILSERYAKRIKSQS